MKKKTNPKVNPRQLKLDYEFNLIATVLADLYHAKNIKYDDSFSKVHKTYQEAHYNIKRKFDRLEALAKKGRLKSLNKDDLTGLVRELGDMAVYSIMSIMKFAPKSVRKNYWHFLMSDL